MRDERDEAIDAALKALREVAPPEGMEERVAGRLERAVEVAGRDSATRGWWSGAACGAAVATLAIGVVIFAQHRWGATPETRQAVARVAGRQDAGALATAYAKHGSTDTGRGAPCASRISQRAHIAAVSPGVVVVPTAGELRAETTAPSKPAPELPLTEQERELVRLARTVDPKQLVALDDTTQAKMEAEDAAEFERFFTPPPAPPLPATEENE
jgi:hypothetical protein